MISFNNNIIVSSVAVFVLTVIAGGLICVVMSKKRRKYERVAKVFKLIIYPVKSLTGIEVNQLEVTKSGVKCGQFRDRSWILIDNNNHFVTLRQEPSLALLKTSFHGNQLWIDGPDLSTLKLDLKTQIQSNDILIETKVWGQPVQGVHCGPEAEQWFSNYLNKPGIKLIQHLDSLTMRSSSAEVRNKVIKMDKYPITFQDGSGLLLMNQKSIDELNSKLIADNISEISYRNYRPNVLVSDCNPLQEDNWLYIKIKETELTFLKPCERCVLTIVDPQTGVKGNGRSLDTLRSYRLADESKKKLYGTSPLFGVNFGTDIEGKVSIGDDVLAVNRI